MTVDACAELVAKGDPDRFAATMSAPRELRGRLLVLYAFNLEVARAPWVTQEPMIAEMRIQWWVDAIAEIFEGREPRRHEVVSPLVDVIAEAGLTREAFDQLMQARRQDIYGEPAADMTVLWDYLDATSGGLVELAATALGASSAASEISRQFGQGIGAANLLVSLPALEKAGKFVLPAGDTGEVIKELAQGGQKRLRAARKGRRDIPGSAKAAFLTGWQADAILSRANSTPDAVHEGSLLSSEFSRKTSLIARTLSGRW